MATARKLRKEASSLLRISKAAFKFIRDHVEESPERKELLRDMQEVLDRTDPPTEDEDLFTINLVMTNPTADTIIRVLDERSKQFEEDEAVLELFCESIRRTKQRVFVRLDIVPHVLRRLHYVLNHTDAGLQSKPFERLADQIDKELAEKNPMEILGKLGL